MFIYSYQYIWVFILFTTLLSQRIENSLLFHINNNIDELIIEKSSEGEIYTNSEKLNKFIHENNINHLERWMISADKSDVSNGIHLDRIYRILFEFESMDKIEIVCFDLAKHLKQLQVQYQLQRMKSPD